MTLVSIVILNWNGKNYLEKFLPSLVENSQVDGVEIVVADNASSDGSMEYMVKNHPGIRCIKLDRNYGFTGGYNRALEQIEAKYYILLNSDVEVTSGWLGPLVEHMETHPGCALCSPKVLDYQNQSSFEYSGAAGGFIDRFGYPFCRGRIFDKIEEDRGQYDQPGEIFWATGACLMVRSEVYGKAGGLDEQFFAHMEEIDLCWRLQRMGYSIWYVPDSTIYHVGGGTLAYHNPRKTYYNFRNNLLLLYKNLDPEKRGRTMLARKLLDGVSALRFLLRGAFGDFRAVFRAHMDYYGMKKAYAGMEKKNFSEKNNVIVKGIYPGSIVTDFFLKGKKTFDQLDWKE